MKKLFITFVFFSLTLQAALLEDIYIFKAQNAYKSKNYEKALQYYKKIKIKNDKILYNMGNIYYILKKYQKAVEYYERINSQKLQHKKYHNMADCYVKLQDYDKAVVFNKKALEFKNDERTKYNLELSIMIQTQIMKKIKQVHKKDSKTRVGKTIEVDEANFFDNDDFGDESSLKEAKKDTYIKTNQNLSTSKDTQEGLITIKQNKQNENKPKEKKLYTKLRLNSYLEQKWDKNLKKTDIHTLLIPLEKGIINDSKKPW